MRALLALCLTLFLTHSSLFSFQKPNLSPMLGIPKLLERAALDPIVRDTKQIELPGFTGAYNPSLIQYRAGFLLTFRYSPTPAKPSISYIGVVLLNEVLEPISSPQLLDTRVGSKVPSQSEDARVFALKDKLYLLYNDNRECFDPELKGRRDMYLSELMFSEDHFSLSTPLKMVHATKNGEQLWEKNWMPFVHEGHLYFVYSIVPHEILLADLETGACRPVFNTPTPSIWEWGKERGGTPALLFEGEYLAFFQSTTRTLEHMKHSKTRKPYFIGAYTFSNTSPFAVTKMALFPILDKSFYIPGEEKAIVFPTGFVTTPSSIYLSYGRNDREIWIATLNIDALKRHLQPLKLKS